MATKHNAAILNDERRELAHQNHAGRKLDAGVAQQPGGGIVEPRDVEDERPGRVEESVGQINLRGELGRFQRAGEVEVSFPVRGTGQPRPGGHAHH